MAVALHTCFIQVAFYVKERLCRSQLKIPFGASSEACSAIVTTIDLFSMSSCIATR